MLYNYWNFYQFFEISCQYNDVVIYDEKTTANIDFLFRLRFCKFVIVKKDWIMPKIFEYLGILIFFYSNEHEPIHVHAKKGEYESKAEFYIVNGEISEIKITNISGAQPLKGKELKDFEVFLEKYADQIVEKWINYFVYHKEVVFEKITKRLK